MIHLFKYTKGFQKLGFLIQPLKYVVTEMRFGTRMLIKHVDMHEYHTSNIIEYLLFYNDSIGMAHTV